tara:strand:+ start:839 stop:3403 length:2565 start_codon:yes stop_codon:yes gene_type:complete
MVLNPFFTQGTSSEQNLVQSLINEQLRMYGVDIYYIPRKYMTENTVIREVVQSKFDSALPIEAYVDNYDAYSGAGDVLSKFGIESKDEVRLIISRERYENYITPLIQGQANIKLSTRPKGGDLIWFPLDDRLYEIKDIEYAKPYYQLQNLYVYELYCELFRYQDEVIDTGIEDIDNELLGDETDGLTDDGISTIQGVTQTLTMVGDAVSASAISGIVLGGVRKFTITNRGGGYGMIPTVQVSSAPAGGLTAVGIASMIGGINVCNLNSNPRLQSVQRVDVTNAGSGYTVAPSLTFSTTDNTGSGAAATASLSEIGGVGIVTLSNSGGGFVEPPTVTFSRPKHVGAAATATLDSPIVGGGVSVTSTTISIGTSAYLFPGGTTGGVFYKQAPIVTFSLPTGTGNGAEATATLDNINLTGGKVATLGLTTGGKFYTSVPTVSISHPGFSFASATIGIAGSSVNPGSIAFSTTGRAYTTAPTVAISTSGTMDAPTQVAVGIATIHPITGIITAVSFNTSDSWATGTGATIGAGYTVAPSISFSGNPSPVQATASVTVSIAGTVSTISIGNSGFGYNSVPTVSIGAPGGANEAFRALGIATIRFNSVKTEGTVGIGSTTITGITTTNILVGDRVRLGVGYSDLYNFIPTDTFVTSIGSSIVSINQAPTNVGIATSVFEFGIDKCGIVTGIAVTFGGGGYLSPPVVSISNTVGDKNYIDQVVGVATATGLSVISAAGTITSINVTDSGNKYILPPDITISEPSSTSSGEFVFNEIVTGSTTGVTARVRSWNSTTNLLEIAAVSGSFSLGETLTGSTSGATRVLRVVDKTIDNDPFADNFNIESAADSILDFSEQNPFGMP